MPIQMDELKTTITSPVLDGPGFVVSGDVWP
jgi:hypothetical protein